MMQKLLLSGVCVVVLSACSTYKSYDAPAMPDGLKTTKLELTEGVFSANAPVAAWWAELSDPMLTELVEKALQHNKDLAVAVANLKEARAYRQSTQFDYAPTITAEANATHTRVSREVPSGASGPRTVETYDVGLDASWELDLFGSVRSGVRAAKASEAAAIANLRDVQVLVAADVANTYMAVRGLQKQVAVTKENVENQRKTFELIQKLADVGRASPLELAQAEAQLGLTESTLPSLAASLFDAKTRLAVLIGETPNALTEKLAALAPLPNVPEMVHVGEMKDLLRRRPDIQRAEKQLMSRIAAYNVSVAAQFPSINLVGSIGFSATDVSNFDSNAVAGFGGPSISWPAFNMGRVRAVIRQNDARTEAALAAYEKTVLNALQDVQSSMNNYTQFSKQRAALQRAAAKSAEAAEIARKRYKVGTLPLIDLLNAENQKLQAESSLAQSDTATLQSLIAIYKAIGGGWYLEKS